jgi:long-chain acyl-CoA synthetase
MEAQTAATPSAAATGSTNLADLVLLATKKHAKLIAMRYKAGDDWVDVSYEELGTIVKEIALGLHAIGIEYGDKVAIVSHTRPEWTYADFGILCAGATTIPVYQTNSPEECLWVISDSEACAIDFARSSAAAWEVTEVGHCGGQFAHMTGSYVR